LAADLRRGARGSLRGLEASTVNPLYDGPKAEVRRLRASGLPGLELWVSVLWGWRSRGALRREGCYRVCQANLARPGREQPKPGRSALRGVRIRGRGWERPDEFWTSSLGDPPPPSQL